MTTIPPIIISADIISADPVCLDQVTPFECSYKGRFYSIDLTTIRQLGSSEKDKWLINSDLTQTYFSTTKKIVWKVLSLIPLIGAKLRNYFFNVDLETSRNLLMTIKDSLGNTEDNENNRIIYKAISIFNQNFPSHEIKIEESTITNTEKSNTRVSTIEEMLKDESSNLNSIEPTQSSITQSSSGNFSAIFSPHNSSDVSGRSSSSSSTEVDEEDDDTRSTSSTSSSISFYTANEVENLDSEQDLSELNVNGDSESEQ